MRLIIGLGNPGEKYKKTRHNLGFAIIDTLAKQLEINDWQFKKRFNALTSQIVINGEKIILAKPQTFMNKSGLAVKALADYFKVADDKILVIHDELDLPLGEFKLQQSRSSAGHRGIQSIIDQLKTKDFFRLRIGIKPLQEKNDIDAEDFVLQKFTDEEEEIISKTAKEAVKIIIDLLHNNFRDEISRF